MRRYLLIFMMCLLPLQWSWAAAASVCEHEQGAAHFGHHEHLHSDDAHAGNASASANEALQPHPDCHTCHGIGVAYLPALDAPYPPWAEGYLRAHGSVAFPEPPPGSLLRPPSSFVA